MAEEDRPSKHVISTELVRDVVEKVLASKIPGQQKGEIISLGQIRENVHIEDIRKEINDQYEEAFKRRLNAVEPERVRNEIIPSIINQLTAVVQRLESAADQVINASEELETILITTDPSIRDEAEKTITRLIELSSFHDLSSQQLQSVIKFLSDIEIIIDGIVGVTGDKEAEKRYHRRGGFVKRAEKSAHRETQAEIDALFKGQARGQTSPKS